MEHSPLFYPDCEIAQAPKTLRSQDAVVTYRTTPSWSHQPGGQKPTVIHILFKSQIKLRGPEATLLLVTPLFLLAHATVNLKKSQGCLALFFSLPIVSSPPTISLRLSEVSRPLLLDFPQAFFPPLLRLKHESDEAVKFLNSFEIDLQELRAAKN